VGLVRAAPGAVGRDGVCAARHAVALGPDPRRAGRVDGSGAPDRGDGRGDAAPGRHRPQLADRPAGHGDRAGPLRCPGQLRPGRQALRRGRRPVPAAAGEPQGRRGVRGEVLLRPVVAHHDRRHPRGSAGQPGPVLGHHRGRPAAPARALRRPGPARRRGAAGLAGRRPARRRRDPAAAARGPLPRDDRGHQDSR
jgi:hypothetical protein